jgi:lipopolysaccharide export system protein LptA
MPRTSQSPSFASRLALLLFAAALAAGPADARKSDRNKEMVIDAGQSTGVLSDNSVSVLSGGVHITQGSLDIKSSTASITLGDGDPIRAVFSGGPVVLKQVLDDGTPMSARASTIDYNMQTEIVVFTGEVSIEQPRGSMSGERVVYNLQTGNVESGGEGSGRVRMRILPRGSRAGTTEPAGEGN